MVLVGHVTKDGAIAGPRVLEHLVDVVLAFEGDRHSTLRMVRGVKNRFGPADEVGCFELRDAGIVGMPDPSGLFLDRFDGPPVPGTAVTVVLDGRRPLPAELQALVTGKDIPSPRRAVSGLDNARVAMLLAVLEKRAGLRLHDAEVYAATVGGMRVLEPAADLALALAIASARRDVALPPDVVVLGEIGLAGEVRRVTGLDRRLAEAARLGFTHALVPPDAGAGPARDEDHRGARHRRGARGDPLSASTSAVRQRGDAGARVSAALAQSGASCALVLAAAPVRSRPGSTVAARGHSKVSDRPGASARPGLRDLVQPGSPRRSTSASASSMSTSAIGPTAAPVRRRHSATHRPTAASDRRMSSRPAVAKRSARPPVAAPPVRRSRGEQPGPAGGQLPEHPQPDAQLLLDHVVGDVVRQLLVVAGAVPRLQRRPVLAVDRDQVTPAGQLGERHPHRPTVAPARGTASRPFGRTVRAAAGTRWAR